MLILTMICLILLTPVRLHLHLFYQEEMQGRLKVQVWNACREFAFRTAMKDGRRQLLWGRSGGKEGPLPSPGEQLQHIKTALSLWKNTHHARQFLLRHIEVTDARFALHLGGENAARIALWTGLMQGIMQTLPYSLRRKVTWRLTPDFFHARSIFQGQCILFFHLGTILVSSAMFFWAYGALKRSKSQNHKEASRHGTSHW